MNLKWHDPDLLLVALGDHVGLWTWEFETGQVQWSDHLLQTLGLSRETFGETYEDFGARLHPDDTGLLEERLEAHLAEGVPYQVRVRMRHAEGHYLTLLAQGSALRDEAGAPIGLAGAVLDVSNEVRIAEELADSLARLRSLTESIPGAVLLYRLFPDGTDTVEYANPGCLDIWEVSTETVAAQPSILWDLVLDEDREEMFAAVAASAEALEPWQHRWRIRTPSGQVKHLEGRGKPSREPDGATLWHTIVLDVSREAEAQQALMTQQKMLAQAQKLESIGRISGGIAHDFNNLLAVILGSAELLEVEADAGTGDRERRLADIVAATERGTRLTRQLLSFARRATLSPVPLALDAVIADLAEMLRRVIPEHIALDIRATPGLWRTRLDQAFLENAIVNLCINARDAMAEGGTLTLEAANLRLPEEDPGDLSADLPAGRYVALSVSDTGAGIPAEALPQVTEPFYTTKGPEGGSGLGLAMVDGFVRQSNGALRIASRPGAGARITLVLPADPEAPAPRAAGSDAGAAEGAEGGDQGAPARHRLLVVEDEPAILSMLRTTLSRAGYDVETAASGDAALEEFGARVAEIDLLLTDIVMPGKLQGRGLAEALTARHPGLRVLFMTGYPRDARSDGDSLPPGQAFLMKPVARSDLLAMIERMLAVQMPAPDAPDAPGRVTPPDRARS